jgi:nicotinic acid mononucleotide adenylyltransferase
VGFIDLLEMLLERDDDGMKEFTLALGADTFMDLSKYKWRRSKDIFQLLKGRIVIFQRKSASCTDMNRAIKDRIDEVAKDLQDICPDVKKNVRLVELPCLSEISSSMVRSSKDESFLSQALNANVLNYIKEKQLYSYEKTKQDRM